MPKKQSKRVKRKPWRQFQWLLNTSELYMIDKLYKVAVKTVLKWGKSQAAVLDAKPPILGNCLKGEV